MLAFLEGRQLPGLQVLLNGARLPQDAKAAPSAEESAAVPSADGSAAAQPD
jgi:hypothetical protein